MTELNSTANKLTKAQVSRSSLTWTEVGSSSGNCATRHRRRVLEQSEATVTVHDSAQSALDALKHTRPTVIVSDIGMPQMDGYQLMRALRATEPPGQRVPALALTAFARSEDRKRSLLAGYQAHIAKPFDVSELVLLVANLVGR